MVLAAPPEERVWRAQPKQREFLRATEDEVLYGGAAGGGKSDALLIDLIRTCVQHPGARTLYVRRKYTDMNQPGACIDRSKRLLAGTANYNESNHRWTFDGGSFLQFKQVLHDSDLDDVQGAQIDRLAVDELTQLPEKHYDFLRTRVRATVPGIQTGVRCGSNPGGRGHGWVRRRWVKAAPWNTPFTVTEQIDGHTVTRTLRFIPARLEDNQALMERDPTYINKLLSQTEVQRRMFYHGDWDVAEGMAFGEWRDELHVCAPFRIPDHWARWRGLDYGYAAPSCCLWFARSDTPAWSGGPPRIYVYREFYQREMTAQDQALWIHSHSAGERVLTTYADPAMFARPLNGQGATLADEFAAAGVPLTRANNARLIGWEKVHKALAHEDLFPPLLQVFSTCTNLIETLPMLPRDETDPEDVDTDADDHAGDALRYGLMGAEQPAHRESRKASWGK